MLPELSSVKRRFGTMLLPPAEASGNWEIVTWANAGCAARLAASP